MKVEVLTWALFDLANTFFAVAMLSFYFPLWVIEECGAPELLFSITLGISMACVAVLMPFCGAVSDVMGERMRLLRWTTYGCTLATGLIGLTSHLGIALLLFGIANVCYQLGTVFYDALLWRIASQERALGEISGFGASCGYLGSMVGLLLLWPFVHAGGHAAAFTPSAGFFLLFALPSFLCIRETSAHASATWRDVIRMGALRLALTIRSARGLRMLWRFLWASFFSMSAINTVLVFMAVYTRKVMGFTDVQIIRFFLFSQFFAIVGSLAFGRLVPRWGAKRTLSCIWIGWMGALALAATNLSLWLLWIVGPMIGFCLGSTWATARVLIIELSPKDQLGEMLGLAGLFARISSILGPLLWGLLVLDPSRHRFAVLLLIGLLALGSGLLQRVQMPRAA